MQTMILISVTGVNIILWFFAWRRFKLRFSPEYMLTEIKREVEKLIMEINRTADQDVTILEARIKALRELIVSADECLERSENAKKTEQSHCAPPRCAIPAVDAEDIPETLEFDFDEDAVTVDIDFKNFSNDKELPDIIIPKEEKKEAPQKEVPVRDRVLQLYEAGLSKDIISAQLNISERETELIIEMYANN